MILKANHIGNQIKTNTEMKPLICEVENFFTVMKHKLQSYLE